MRKEKNEKNMDFLRKFCAWLIMFCYFVNILPARELSFSMEKSLERLDFYLETGKNYSETDWKKLAEKSILAAMEDWEGENLHLKEADPEMYENAFLEAEKMLKLETEKKYVQWLCQRSREKSVFENTQKLRMKISQLAADFETGGEEKNFSDLQRSFSEKTEAVISLFLEELEQKEIFDGLTLDQIEKEGKMLAEAEQSRFLTQFLSDKSCENSEKNQKLAGLVGQSITDRTVEETGRLLNSLFDSFEEKIENPDSQSPETENLLEKFQEVFEQGLKLWEQAEQDFLSERMDWERQAGETFYETEKIWQAALNELTEKKLDWEMEVQERIEQIQKKIEQESEKYRQQISDSLDEYSASLEKQLNSKLQAVYAYSGIYGNLRQALAAVYSGICAACESFESENSEKYRGLYSYWKTEAGEKVEGIDEDFCQKLKKYIEENENLRGDRKAVSFYGWFEQARDYNLKLKQVVEKIDGLSGAGIGFEEEVAGAAGSAGIGEGSSDLDLEIYRLEIQQKYWLEEREIAEAVAEYVQADREQRLTEEQTLVNKQSAEEEYKLACEEYEKSLENLKVLEEQVQQLCSELDNVWNEVKGAEKKLQDAEEEYRRFYAEKLGIDEETLVLQLASCLEKLQSARKNRDEVLQFLYESEYFPLETAECEKLTENEERILGCWKEAVNCLEEFKKQFEEYEISVPMESSWSEVFRTAKEKIDGIYAEGAESTGYEISNFSETYGNQLSVIEEKIKNFDSLWIQFLQKRKEEKKLIDEQYALKKAQTIFEDEWDKERTEKLWQKQAEDELNKKVFADKFSLEILKAEILCLVVEVLNWEKQKKAELDGLGSIYEEDCDPDDWSYYETLSGFRPEIDDYYGDLTAILKLDGAGLYVIQKSDFEKQLKNLREKQEEIYESIKESDEENRKSVMVYKASCIKNEREKLKKDIYKTVSGSPACTVDSYENVLNFCYSLLTEAGKGPESLLQGVENFLEAYLERESFRYGMVLKAEVNLEDLEKKITSLNEEISAFEKLMEENSGTPENAGTPESTADSSGKSPAENPTLENQKEPVKIDGQAVENYLKSKIRSQFLTLLQTNLKTSPVLDFETLNKYVFQKNSFLTEGEQTEFGQILENSVTEEFKNLENAVLLATKVFNVKADSRLSRSDSEKNSINSKVSDYEFYNTSLDKQISKLSLLTKTFNDFSSQETKDKLEAKNATIQQCNDELIQSLEKYKLQTEEYEKNAAIYDKSFENSKFLYEQTEKCRLEKRKAQAIYDCSQNIYLDFAEDSDFEVFKSPSARLEQAETVLKRLDFALSELKKLSLQKSNPLENGEAKASSLSVSIKNFTEADRNYYLACALNQKIISAVEKEKEALELAEKNERIFRENLVTPLKEKSFVFTECVKAEYSEENRKYIIFLNKNDLETEEEKQKNEKTQKEFFTANFNSTADSAKVNADENFISAAETEILNWLSKMVSQEEYFKEVILASVYWLSEKESGYENSIYNSGMNTDREMGDAHGIGADDYFKKYVINTAKDAFFKLENTVNEEDIAKCVLFRKSSSLFAETIASMEKNLLRSLAFGQVEAKMDKRKKDNDCCYFIIKFLTGYRTYNSKGRAAINYSERAESLKKSTYLIYESAFSELAGNVKSYQNSLKNKDIALKKYNEVLFGKNSSEEGNRETSDEKQKITWQKAETMLKESVFGDLDDFEVSDNEILKIVSTVREKDKLEETGEEPEEFENLLDFSEKLLGHYESSLQTTSVKLKEQYSSAETATSEAQKEFFDRIYLWSGDEKTDEAEIQDFARRAFGENSVTTSEADASLLNYYKEYFKKDRSFTLENLNEAKDWFFFFSGEEESAAGSVAESVTESVTEAVTEVVTSVTENSVDGVKKSVTERYISHFFNYENLKGIFSLNRQQIFLEGALKSWEKENTDVLEQLFLISAISQREWSRAEEKLNARYNSWLWDFSKKYVQSDTLWQENYEEFLSGKQLWISQMYESAATETGFVGSAGGDYEKSAENALKKIKLKKIGEIEKQEFNASSIVGELLKNTALSELKNRFENVTFRAGQSNFYVPALEAKTFRNEEQIEIQKITEEVSRMMKKTSEKYSAQTAAEMLQNSVEQEFQKISLMNDAAQKQVQNLVFEEGYSQNDKDYSRKVLVHSYLLKDTYKNQNVHFYSYFTAEKPQFLYSLSDFEGFEENSLLTILNGLQNELKDWVLEIFGIHDGSSSIDGLIDLHIGTLPGEKSIKGSGELGKISGELEENRNEMLAGLSEMELAPWDKQIAPSSVNWVEVPSLRSLCTYATAVAASVATAVLSVVSFGTMAAPLAALCTAGISAAITSSTETAFAALDVCGGYKNWTEAGKQLAASAVTNSISALGGAAGAVVQGVGGIGGALLKMGVDATASVAGSAAASAVHTGSFTTFARDLSDFDGWSSALVRGLGGFTTSVLGTIDYTGFTSSQLKNISQFNSLVGGLAGNAAEYACCGQTSFNLLNLSQFSDGRLNSGLIELKIGKQGTKLALGTGGTDINFQKVTSAFSGAVDFRKNIQIEVFSRANNMDGFQTSLRFQHGFGTESEAKLLDEILSGKTKIQFSQDEKGLARTEFGGTSKTVILNSSLKDLNVEDQLKLGVILSHESFRDGISDSSSGQKLETLSAVFGHTAFANKIASDPAYRDVMSKILSSDSDFAQNLRSDFKAFFSGDFNSLSDYAEKNYDSTSDYWKLTSQGDIEYDGKTNLTDEFGNILYKSTSKGLEGSLVEILCGKNATSEQKQQVQNLMAEFLTYRVEGSDSENRENWYWNGSVKKENMGKKISADRVFGEYSATIATKAFARFYDDVTSYAVGKYLKLDMGNVTELSAFKNLDRNVPLDARVLNRINALCNAKLQFLQNQSALVGTLNINVSTEFKEVDLKSYFSYDNQHFGIDLATGENREDGIEGKKIYSGFSGQVTNVTELKNRPRDGNGIYIEYGYGFEGEFISTGFKGEYLHMKEKSTLVTGDYVNANTPIGLVGNTGSASTGPHLHYTTFTEKNTYYSDFMGTLMFGENAMNDKMTNSTGNKTVYNPINFYDLNKNKIEPQKNRQSFVSRGFEYLKKNLYFNYYFATR